MAFPRFLTNWKFDWPGRANSAALGAQLKRFLTSPPSLSLLVRLSNCLCFATRPPPSPLTSG
jgi:hypothetical protein